MAVSLRRPVGDITDLIRRLSIWRDRRQGPLLRGLRCPGDTVTEVRVEKR